MSIGWGLEAFIVCATSRKFVTAGVERGGDMDAIFGVCEVVSVVSVVVVEYLVGREAGLMYQTEIEGWPSGRVACC